MTWSWRMLTASNTLEVSPPGMGSWTKTPGLESSQALGQLCNRAMNHHNVTLTTKLMVYKAIIHPPPSLLYGSEAWTVHHRHLKQVENLSMHYDLLLTSIGRTRSPTWKCLTKQTAPPSKLAGPCHNERSLHPKITAVCSVCRGSLLSAPLCQFSKDTFFRVSFDNLKWCDISSAELVGMLSPGELPFTWRTSGATRHRLRVWRV